MRHASDSSDDSGYEEGTETTEEEPSENGSEADDAQHGDNLPIPVPQPQRQAPDAALPTSARVRQAPTPENVNAESSGPLYASGTGRPPQGLSAAAMDSPTGSPVRGGQLIANNPNDERIDVRNAETVATPRASMRPSYGHEADAGRVGGGGGGAGGMGQTIENAPHDEAIPVSPTASQVATPMAMRTGHAMRPDDEEDGEEEQEDEEGADEEGADEEAEGNEDHEYRAEGYAGQKPTELGEAAPVAPVGDPQLGYNPAKYARVNATANREMQELFKQIPKYEPFAAELPAKLRPFVPDYIPAIGDLDPFVKVPRPDGKPDGLGLDVVDEPAIPQSNPAVVLLELNATNAHGVAADVVDSLENAANRPEVIDRWISDIKKVHYKKALPTVNYQRPMPDIETLMQVWPQQFEEVLNSDVPFPPSHIDLDLDQYVRTLCAILDIPTYTSLIDSLHVMFTLYEEFRSNQHFQHV